MSRATERRAPRWAWALAAVPVLALAFVALQVLREEPPPGRVPATPVDPQAAATPSAAQRVNGRPNDVLRAGGRLWVLRSTIGRVAYSQDGELRAGPPVGGSPTALAAGFGRLWVSDARPPSVRAIDLGTLRADGVPIGLEVGGEAVDVAAGQGAIWVGVRGRPGRIARVDPRERRVTEVIPVADGVQNLAVGYGAVWVTTRRRDAIVRVDIAAGTQRAIPVGRTPRGVATGGGAVWVVNNGDDSVTRIDRRSLATRAIPVGRRPYGVDVGRDAVFVSNTGDDTVTRLDPRTGDMVGVPVRTGNGPAALDVSGPFVHVASPPDRTVYRLAIAPAP